MDNVRLTFMSFSLTLATLYLHMWQQYCELLKMWKYLNFGKLPPDAILVTTAFQGACFEELLEPHEALFCEEKSENFNERQLKLTNHLIECVEFLIILAFFFFELAFIILPHSLFVPHARITRSCKNFFHVMV